MVIVIVVFLKRFCMLVLILEVCLGFFCKFCVMICLVKWCCDLLWKLGLLM